MSARAILLAASFLLCAAPGAQAQEAAAPPVASAPAPMSATDAGGEVMRALVIGSGLLDMAFEPVMSEVMPQIRAELANSPFYRSLTRRHREALSAFFESAPALLRRELETEVETIAVRAGPRLAELMTAEELIGIAEFLRSPDARPLFQSIVQRRVVEGSKDEATADDFSDEDLRIVTQFMTTPAGIAFFRHSEQINTITREEFDAASARMMPRLQIIIFRGMCEAIEDECPPALRSQAQPS